MATKRTKRGVKRNVEQLGKSNSFDWQDKQIIGISCRINVKIWHNTSYMAVKVELTEHFSWLQRRTCRRVNSTRKKEWISCYEKIWRIFFHFQLELYKALWFITCLFSLWAHWRGGQRVLPLLVFIYNICYWVDELATDCRTTREFLAQWCVWSTYVDTSRFRSRTAFSLRRGHIWRNNVIEVAHWDSLLFLLQSSEPVRREK